MTTKKSAICSLFTLIALAAKAQAVQVFVDANFDRSAWEAAASGTVTTDPFDNNKANASILALDSGVTSTASGAQGSPNHNVNGGRFNTALYPAGSASAGYLTITWTFNSPVNAFGADFFSIAGSRQVGPTGDFDSGTEHYDLRTLFIGDGGLDQGFFGVVSATPFTQITLEATGSGTNDAFTVDNLSFVSVPEPSSTALLAFGGIGFILRRQRK
ncbi:MAG: PEP-CTERM sorting domain-containing protein [Akkermansiaceae bacterium]